MVMVVQIDLTHIWPSVLRYLACQKDTNVQAHFVYTMFYECLLTWCSPSAVMLSNEPRY